MRIALTGNPNSGKTTMYNVLTGRHERVGNWAGVTVEKKESPIRRAYRDGGEEVIVVDLPGAYSMSPFTSEECITSAYVKGENPDVIINIVDGSNLSRSLFFTTQLLELGIPMVVALNKSDINAKKNTVIDTALLSEKLGCPVIQTVSTARRQNGLADVIREAKGRKDLPQTAHFVQRETDLQDRQAVEAEDRRRFAFVQEIVSAVERRETIAKRETVQDRVDRVLSSKAVGLPVFGAVMFLVFYISQSTVGTWIADWLVSGIEIFQGWAAQMTEGVNPFFQALLVDGIIGGVGAVVGFLPLVMVMYFLIALLEDCGYMARAAIVLDPVFKRVGLSGKSVIPMVIGTGCAIPGIMACRTIRNERERRTTAMLTPFMPCGAKLPVIALFSGAFFADASWVGPLMYFAGILLIFLGALLVKAITGYRYRKSFFIIELPEYKFPSLKRAALSMFSRGKAYVIKAGTIILMCNAVIQIMQTFNWKLQLVEEGMEQTSILASIASPFAVLLIPLGFGAWQLAAAAITGFIAKENVVGTLAVVYGLTNFIDTEELALVSGGSQVAAVMGLTKAAALAYLMFNLFTPPCFAAIGAMNAEMQDRRWLWAGIGLQMGVGYSVAFFVYQAGTVHTTGTVGSGFLPGLLGFMALGVTVVFLVRNGSQKFHAQYQFHET